MPWVGLSFSLPSAAASSRRVAVWRRLRGLGAVSPTGSLYLLPAQDETQEAFEWLAEEIESGGGEALVLKVDRLDEDAERRIVALARTARDEDYEKLEAEAQKAAQVSGPARRDRLEKLRRRFDEIVRIDFFHASARDAAAAALARLEATPGRDGAASNAVSRAPGLERYRGRRWVTRPHPHVDRLASIWLIRRFVDAGAAVRYGDKPLEGEISFDMRNADFGHRNGLCTFETLLAAFGLKGDPGLASIAEIVREIDLRDGSSARAETPGIALTLRGWSTAGWDDTELEGHGVALFEGLYLALSMSGVSPDPPSAEALPSAAPAPRGAYRRRRKGS